MNTYDENYRSDATNWIQNPKKCHINVMDCKVKQTKMVSGSTVMYEKFNSVTHIASSNLGNDNIFYSPEKLSDQ